MFSRNGVGSRLMSRLAAVTLSIFRCVCYIIPLNSGSSSRNAPFTPNGFFKTLSRVAESIGMGDVHPHLLRHACGFKLVNQGVDTRTLAAYLGHRQIANIAHYTKMDARRFDGFWQD